MYLYIGQKLLASIPVLLGVSLLVFFIVHLTPGDPARLLAGPDAYEEDVEAIRERLGLNDPLYIQYVRFISNAVRLDFGRSFRTGRPATYDIFRRFPNTLELAVVSMLWATTFGVFIGVIAAIRPGSTLDGLSIGGALVGVSAPSFWRGLLLMLLLSYYLRWLPASGRGGPLWTIEGIRTIIMPAITLGTGAAAVLARITRSSLLEIMGEDFIRTARSKGLSERVVIYRHGLRNALIPVITVAGLQMGFLLGGAVIVEQVFAWPGIGTLVVNGIFARDYPTIQAVILMIGTIFVLINLITDLFYALLDPRIRYV